MNILALMIGGFLGTLLRYGLSLWIPSVGAFPLPILLINWAGCLFLGWLLTVSAIRNLPSSVRLGAGTGFTGAFTTFSTFTVQTVDAIHNGHLAAALSYLLASLIGGLLMAWAGVALGQKARNSKAGESK
ncbi:fluoride efflux transporter CrcB [Paenibacillus phocaensis]|uniref:fluoride efflux transporter CrcB n=1 Tax=Paenibacillus phocaensis TaxID=1776378 RepID=UPI00039DD2C6|nr:fluoride efflux transporter CrcB [Paenibacillus phocaensis]